ncbi:hypothetical protein VZT92_014319 [Zoarces viviparus]|uniref:Uncharacterized protein n=1 Tax=Zoarces viviparus TaxID=48416 RepID=A0AAW1EZ52_ZOAVI
MPATTQAPPCDDDPFNSINVLTSVNRGPATLLLVARKHHVTGQLALAKSKAAFSSLAAGKHHLLPPPELNPLCGFNAGLLSGPYRPCNEAFPVAKWASVAKLSFSLGPVETVGEVCGCVCVPKQETCSTM